MIQDLTPVLYKDALKATEEYFNGENLPATVWIDKYNLKDSYGNLYETTPDDTHWRLSDEFARVDKKYPNPMLSAEYFNLMKDFKYLVPQGSPLAGIGNNMQIVSLSNCFVIGNEGPSDSYGAILKIDEEQIQLMKRRGGVGSDLSNIRPADSSVKNSALTSTGIVPFMERYSNSTREVAQAGRRGARMLSCFSEGTIISTDKGEIEISDLIQRYNNKESIRVWTHEGYKPVEHTQTIPNRELYEVSLEDGKTIQVTEDHKFVIYNKETKKEYLKELRDIDLETELLVSYE